MRSRSFGQYCDDRAGSTSRTQLGVHQRGVVQRLIKKRDFALVVSDFKGLVANMAGFGSGVYRRGNKRRWRPGCSDGWCCGHDTRSVEWRSRATYLRSLLFLCQAAAFVFLTITTGAGIIASDLNSRHGDRTGCQLMNINLAVMRNAYLTLNTLHRTVLTGENLNDSHGSKIPDLGVWQRKWFTPCTG